jgi:hypothetical protein
MLRRGDVLPPAAAATPAAGRSVARLRDLTPRPGLRELTAGTPGLREELVDRARSAGLLIGSVALVLVPAWAVVDRVVVPDQAGTFLAIRLLG